MDEIIRKANKGPLSEADATLAFSTIMNGNASTDEIIDFLLALKNRGETVQEIISAAKVMRNKCVKVKAPPGAIDIVGTGGDGIGTLNISTATAIVVASCGVTVAKHGNKNISSKSGAADVLQHLGVEIMLKPKTIEKTLKLAKIGFMMAPLHHPAVKHVMPARQILKTQTIFNLLGPLTNPASVKFQLTGAFNKTLLCPMATALKELECKRVWVVHGMDGTDELSICGPSHVVELSKGEIKSFNISPLDAGLSTYPIEEILGGSPEENAVCLNQLLSGKTGAYRDAVLLNSAAALLISEKVGNLTDGVKVASQALDNGIAKRTLNKLKEISQEK